MDQHGVATPDNPGELDELIARFAEDVDQSEGTTREVSLHAMMLIGGTRR